MRRSLNTSLKLSWLALARAKRLLDQEKRPRGGDLVGERSSQALNPSSSSINPRKGKRSKVAILTSIHHENFSVGCLVYQEQKPFGFIIFHRAYL